MPGNIYRDLRAPLRVTPPRRSEARFLRRGRSGSMKLKRGLGRPRGRLVQRDLISFLYYLFKATVTSSQPRSPITIEHVQQPSGHLFPVFFFAFQGCHFSKMKIIRESLVFFKSCIFLPHIILCLWNRSIFSTIK